MTDLNSLVKYQEDLSDLTATIIDLQKEVASAKQVDFAALISHGKFSDLGGVLESRGVDISDRYSVGVALLELKKDLAQLERLRVVFPCSPHEDFSSKFMDSVFNWLKENILGGKPFLIETTVDPEILGGVVIYWQGQVINLSLRKKLEAYFEKTHVNLRSGIKGRSATYVSG